MTVEIRLAALKGIKLHEWLLRFVFGGLVCVAAGLIAKRFGPGIGGLFLAFPAIFPASASLVEAHEKQHKARAGLDGTRRGRVVAGVDAAGTSLGCVGLVSFGLVCGFGLPHIGTLTVFGLACGAWLATGSSLWWLRKSRWWRTKRGYKNAYGAFRTS